MKYENVLSRFKVEGKVKICELYGEGHINETNYVETDAGRKYILQKINNRIFTDVCGLMSNIVLVTEHVGKKIAALGGDVLRETLSVIRTLEGKPFLETDGSFFRLYNFIDDAVCYQVVEKPQHFYECAAAFGKFQNYLADFDASKLVETIVDFHNTEKRLNDFKNSVKQNKSGRLNEVLKEVDFVLERGAYAGKIVDLLKTGKMPLRVTHNDTKLNNVMVDNKTEKAVAVIDLDTVMPGSSCYDFGDSIRFGCNSALEDERDLSKVFFKIDLFESYVKGYLEQLKNITPIEKENLAFSSILMTYECGMRFLADHLNGDIYFRIKRDGHNLDRARTQFKLISDMEKALPKMNEIVFKY